MGFDNKYPYTDFHELNLDWLLEKVKGIDDRFVAIEDAVAALREDLDIQTGRIDAALDAITFIQNHYPAMIASEYDENRQYDPGEIAIYDNELYIALPGETPGPWNGNYWNKTSLGDELGTIIIKVNDIILPDLTNINNVLAEYGTLFDDIVETYVPGSTYVKNQMVKYEDHIYRVMVASTNNPPTDLTDWDPETLANIVTDLLNFWNKIIPEYDENATYNVPDYVIYQGNIYTCNDANVTGAWDGSKWNQVVLTDDIASRLAFMYQMFSTIFGWFDSYDNTMTYDAGDYVMENGNLYRAIVGVPTNTLPDSSPDYWVPLTITSELKNKPDAVGEYENMLVGSAKGIYTGNFNDKAPYIIRSISDRGNMAIMNKLIGGSVVWNQLVDSGTTDVTIPSGHKYILWNGLALSLATSDGSAVSVSSGYKFYDITQMFGTTVENQMTTTKFASLFPNYANYAYSAPTIQSTKVSAKVVKDANDQTVATYDLSGSHLVKRKYALVDLGTLDWSELSSPSQHIFRTKKTDASYMTPATLLNNAICEKYDNESWSTISASTDKKFSIGGSGNNNRLVIVDSAYSDVTTFTNAMSGVYLLYELATPTTETVTNPTLYGIWKLDANNNLYFDGDEVSDIPNPQIVPDGGTEEYIDAAVIDGLRDVSIPAGQDTDYSEDLVKKLEDLPYIPIYDASIASQIGITLNDKKVMRKYIEVTGISSGTQTMSDIFDWTDVSTIVSMSGCYTGDDDGVMVSLGAAQYIENPSGDATFYINAIGTNTTYTLHLVIDYIEA